MLLIRSGIYCYFRILSTLFQHLGPKLGHYHTGNPMKSVRVICHLSVIQIQVLFIVFPGCSMQQLSKPFAGRWVEPTELTTLKDTPVAILIFEECLCPVLLTPLHQGSLLVGSEAWMSADPPSMQPRGNAARMIAVG